MNVGEVIAESVDLSDADTSSKTDLPATCADVAETRRMAVPDKRPSADERNLQLEFPMGWFAVCYSDELAAGQVKPVRYVCDGDGPFGWIKICYAQFYARSPKALGRIAA